MKYALYLLLLFSLFSDASTSMEDVFKLLPKYYSKINDAYDNGKLPVTTLSSEVLTKKWQLEFHKKPSCNKYGCFGAWTQIKLKGTYVGPPIKFKASLQCFDEWNDIVLSREVYSKVVENVKLLNPVNYNGWGYAYEKYELLEDEMNKFEELLGMNHLKNNFNPNGIFSLGSHIYLSFDDITIDSIRVDYCLFKDLKFKQEGNSNFLHVLKNYNQLIYDAKIRSLQSQINIKIDKLEGLDENSASYKILQAEISELEIRKNELCRIWGECDKEAHDVSETVGWEDME
jgi:hypothetical protein